MTQPAPPDRIDYWARRVPGGWQVIVGRRDGMTYTQHPVGSTMSEGTMLTALRSTTPRPVRVTRTPPVHVTRTGAST